MTDSSRHDAWKAGESYDLYMGRLSRAVAPHFLRWLGMPQGGDWLEIGCGTGAFSATILAEGRPRRLICIDPSDDFIAQARRNVGDPRADFRVGDAQALALETESQDVVVSGLVLNFVTDKSKALSEMRRVAHHGATIGFYVWDYPGGGIEFINRFWTAAASLDASAADLTEDRRFPACTPQHLEALASDAGLQAIDLAAIEIPTVFKNFEDYWRPFTLGAGPAPGYCMSLDEGARERLRAKLQDNLPPGAGGEISLKARAWALKAVAP